MKQRPASTLAARAFFFEFEKKDAQMEHVDRAIGPPVQSIADEQTKGNRAASPTVHEQTKHGCGGGQLSWRRLGGR
jgi:hypothetical protein